MATPSLHALDFVELAGYGEGDEGIRFLKDLDSEIAGRDVLLVDAVIDTGLTMHYLVRSLALRQPGVAPHRDAVRPPLPAARRRPAGPLRRLHDPGRVLRRLRLRARGALPQPARPSPRPPRRLSRGATRAESDVGGSESRPELAPPATVLGPAKLGACSGRITEPLPAGLRTVDEALHRTRFRILPFLGPAFIACVAYIDPGNFATNIAGGSKFGYRLVWVIVAANLLAMLIQTLSAKLGIATQRNLPEVCREQFPRKVSLALWFQAEAIAMATDLAEFLGAAIGIHLLIGMGLFPAARHLGPRRVRDPRHAALRLPPVRVGDRGARRRDRRLLCRRARLCEARLEPGAEARGRRHSSAAARRCCSRSGSSARR